MGSISGRPLHRGAFPGGKLLHPIDALRYDTPVHLEKLLSGIVRFRVWFGLRVVLVWVGFGRCGCVACGGA